jgi:hypothetical protein
MASFALCSCVGSGATPPPSNSPPSLPLVAGRLKSTPLNAPTSLFPGATSTEPTQIRANLIAATVTLKSGRTVGALYDRNTGKWLPIEVPSSTSTAAYAVNLPSEGDTVVAGSYTTKGSTLYHGFVYDSHLKRYRTVDLSGNWCAYQLPCSIFPHNVSWLPNFGGFYGLAGILQPASSSKAAFTRGYIEGTSKHGTATFGVDKPGACCTTVYGIWSHGKDSTIAGSYTDTHGTYGWIRGSSDRKRINFSYHYPHAAITYFTDIEGAGAFGNYDLVGNYSDASGSNAYGFFLRVRSWQASKVIVIGKVKADSLYDRTVVGYDPGKNSGFIVTLP